MQWGVSLGTVRRAINLLHAEGLVDPIPGVGAVVRDNEPVRLAITRYTEATQDAGPWEVACASQGLAGFTEVTGVAWEPAGELVARELGVKAGEALCHRGNRMWAGDQILQLQDTYLPQWVASGNLLSRPEKVTGGIYRGLREVGRPPQSSTETVTARMPTQGEAELLGLRLGSPVLDARRTTRDAAGAVLVHTHVVVAADRVCFVYPQQL